MLRKRGPFRKWLLGLGVLLAGLTGWASLVGAEGRGALPVGSCGDGRFSVPSREVPAGRVWPAGQGRAVLQSTPLYTYRVLNVYPHDPNAFTQGLVYTDSILYEGTGLYGQSSLRKVDLETGEVLQILNLPDQYFGEGIVVYGDRVVQLTWREHRGFVYDKDSFDLLDEFSYPTEGWGITYDGQRLIMSDGSARLYFWDPETYEEIGRVQVYDEYGPVQRLNELEYIEGEVYANVWLTDRIVRIDPETGRVVGSIDLKGLLDESGAQAADVLNGIAYDSENDRLFVTGKLWPKLFEIELVEVGQGPNTKWLQVNDDGFEDAGNKAVSALESFGDFLYAGTLHEAGGQIWRSGDGQDWQRVVTAGLGYSSTAGIDDLIAFGDNLYASTYEEGTVGLGGGEIWRTPDGLSWTQVVSGGFGNPSNERILAMVQFSDTLCAGTRNAFTGCEVWCSGDGVDWQGVSTSGFGKAQNTAIGAFAVYDGGLYAGTWNEATGAEIWQWGGLDREGRPASLAGRGGQVPGDGDGGMCKASIGQGIPMGLLPTWRIRQDCQHSAPLFSLGEDLAQPPTWTAVITSGFTISDNVGISSMAIFQDELYALAYNEATGTELWSTGTGVTWTCIFSGGLANPRNEGGGGLILFRGGLYFVSDNRSHGAEVWRTFNGTEWEQIGFQGWGDKGNAGSLADRSLAFFGDRLFVGTLRRETNLSGGEVWSYPYYELFLPVVDRGL